MPIEHIQKAYSDGYYVEAMQVLHGFLELQLRELIYVGKKDKGPHDHYDLAISSMFEISFTAALKVLFIQKIISKDERDKLQHLNRARNNMIHKIYTEDNNGSKGYSKSEYDKALKNGLHLMETLTDRIHKIIWGKAIIKDNRSEL